MSGEPPNAATHPPAAADGASLEPIRSIRSLIAETEASVRRLRSAQIPQHIGMAAACRALAVELPRALAAQIDAEQGDGMLAQRWEAARTTAAQSGAGRELDATLAALALLLRDQCRAAMRHLIRREKEWVADAYRLEGQADALEAQVHQLRQVTGPTASPDVEPSRSDAASQPSPSSMPATDP